MQESIKPDSDSISSFFKWHISLILVTLTPVGVEWEVGCRIIFFL
jgi:hypothetical protein